MKTLSKPTRLLSRLWVFSSLNVTIASVTLTTGFFTSSCQSSPPVTRPSLSSRPINVTSSSSHPRDYQGMSLEAAKAKAENAQLPWRLVRIDGQSRPVTKDYRPNRLNFEITKGKVTRVTRG